MFKYSLKIKLFLIYSTEEVRFCLRPFLFLRDPPKNVSWPNADLAVKGANISAYIVIIVHSSSYQPQK